MCVWVVMVCVWGGGGKGGDGVCWGEGSVGVEMW